MKKTILACLMLFPLTVSAEMVTVTAYTSLKRACVMASGEKIKQDHFMNVIALSPDLAKRFKFGDVFKLKVKGSVYVVEYKDNMPDYHRNKIDFLLPSQKDCMEFGRQKGELTLIKRKR